MRQFDWKRATKMTSSGTHRESPYWKTVFSPSTLTFESMDEIPWCCRSNKTFTVVSLTLCVLLSFTNKFWVSSAWMKSCSVTIQMKSHQQYGYFHLVLSISCINTGTEFWVCKQNLVSVTIAWYHQFSFGQMIYIAMQVYFFTILSLRRFTSEGPQWSGITEKMLGRFKERGNTILVVFKCRSNKQIGD